MRTVFLALLILVSAAHAERLRAPDGTVKDVPAESVDYAIKDGYTRIPKVLMRSPEGKVVEVDEDQVRFAEDSKYWKLTPSEADAYRRGETEEQMADSARDRAAHMRHLDEIEKEVADEKSAEERQGWINFALVAAVGLVLLITLVHFARRHIAGSK